MAFWQSDYRADINDTSSRWLGCHGDCPYPRQPLLFFRLPERAGLSADALRPCLHGGKVKDVTTGKCSDAGQDGFIARVHGDQAIFLGALGRTPYVAGLVTLRPARPLDVSGYLHAEAWKPIAPFAVSGFSHAAARSA
jgi:hypothetical protein